MGSAVGRGEPGWEGAAPGLLLQPQSNVHPPLSVCLSLADSPAMTFLPFACISFIFLFPLLPSWRILGHVFWTIESPHASVWTFGAVGSFRTGKGSESTHKESPPPQTTADGQELPDNGGKPDLVADWDSHLNPSLAGQALNFSLSLSSLLVYTGIPVPARRSYSQVKKLEEFLAQVDTFSICLFFLLCPQPSLPSLGPPCTPPPSGLMLPHLMLQPRACFAFTEH